MVRHIILLGSSYKTGERIALDYPETKKSFNNISKDLTKIKNALKDDSIFAIHILTVDGDKWTDVTNFDPFFKNVRAVKDEKEFVKLLLEDKTLDSLDVAEYILTNFKCSHVRLEKLTYFCYADYLCQYKERLFEDKIYAFKYGPVINNVYKKFKGTYVEEMSDVVIPRISQYYLPIKSRILISKNGYRKLMSIENTLARLKGLTTNELIEMTHKDKTPWTINDRGEKSFKVISDKDILTHHCYEV